MADNVADTKRKRPTPGGFTLTGGKKTAPVGGSTEGPRDQSYDVVQFLKDALAQAGDPSKWGGTTPAGFDCSGLVQFTLLNGPGIKAPRTSEEQAGWAVPVTSGQLQPGDLLFEYGSVPGGGSHIKDGHVAIYLGNGLVLAADETSTVRIRAYTPGEAISAGRVPGLAWDPGATGAQSYLKEIDKLGIKVGQSGPIAVPLPGIKLPTIGAAPKHNTAMYKDQWGNEAIQNPTPSEQYSSYERTLSTMRLWGLDDPKLVSMVHARVVAGEDYNQVIADIRKTPQYAAQFPGMEFRQKAGLPLISESQYITYERYMMGLATKYALPRGFIGKHEIGELIAHNVSPVEFNQRLQGLSTLVTQANPLVRQEFDKKFGVRGSNGALAAYWADPKRATMVLDEQLHAAEYGAQVRETGLGALNRGQAVQLAHYEYLHTPGTVASAITDASHYRNLEGAAPGSTTSSVSVSQLLGSRLAGYAGNQAENAARVRNAESAKEAVLLSGGGFSANPSGVTGAGSASTEGIGRA